MFPTPNAPSTNNKNINGNQATRQQGDPISRFDTNGDNKISESEAKGPLKENFSGIRYE
jgi:hypothetical protein